MESIAHIREDDKQIQTVEDHLLEVKELAESYGEKIGIRHIAGLAGMLHDLGKYTLEFKSYLLEAVNNPDQPPKKGSVDHSTAGGKLLYELLHTQETLRENMYKVFLSEVVGNAIISHHSYLHDFLDPELNSKYLNRVADKELSEFNLTKQCFFNRVISEKEFSLYVDQAAEELEEYLSRHPQDKWWEQLMFLTKYIFSSLIDADRTNTRLFEENNKFKETLDVNQLFQQYYQRLMKKIEFFKNQQNVNEKINVLRSQMSDRCDKFAERPSGIYTLSIPTGGGKTLASLRYALKHAKSYNKKHIIYVVPYTTIIEQNAEEVRTILEDDVNILEHHSNVIEDRKNDDESQDGMITTQQKLKLAKDNWDSPIVFTTLVQFLNVFYANGSRNIRRLHNLSESIIIFDEVQKVPVSCISLFNQAVNFLKNNSNSSILLCTATQPALDFVEHKLDITSDAEIIEDLDSVIQDFKRVEIVDNASYTSFTNDKIIDFLKKKALEVQSMLVVLNTKSVVKNLYNLLKETEWDIPIYHLSTSMCAAHRNIILKEIRDYLNKGKPIICVSTQLIEAGVDVSFDCVIRSLAGLDSIAQAAGRCNRHGEHSIQNVYVIDHEEENLSRLKEIKVGKQIAKQILVDIRGDHNAHGGDILSKQAMDRYFKEYYQILKSDLNYFIPKLDIEMTELLTSPRHLNNYHNAFQKKYNKSIELLITNSYRTAAENFRVIAQNTMPVIVPYGEGKEIIAELNSYRTIEDLSKLLKKAQQYTINLYDFEKDHLIKNDGIVSYLDGNVYALKDGGYNKEYGLVMENDNDLDSLVF
ncbi:CRISPR-associated helicase Cas3' [Aquibacillus salsiterrae]|uniref:CRISPR-associated helicase Cas3 n=1 Tax=Aquibacillus salsiterrae TaxID=2950439 RepID=A0A9X3WCK7_9BACI|nr:CRISPR-associated helicase Cas3' [Aquibacillus salsiterrae]MDC3415896.1 CRISPR-associated helicase Cas3' [Aquibacillus salsiterrae]